LADHRILIVDDEPAICHAVQRVLSREYRTVVALTSAREALVLLEERSFDVVLCDYFMPEMTGAELHALVDPAMHERIVFLTGGALTAKGQDFLARTANPCIIKPFSMTVVSMLVKKVLARRANAITMRPPAFTTGKASAR
jgi:CheY-like chemotaxis protein